MQSSSQIITINKPTSSFFTGRMPFLSPQPTVVKALKGKYHIPWTCLPQAHLRIFKLCLWPLIAPGYLGERLPCLSSALWCQYPTATATDVAKLFINQTPDNTYPHTCSKYYSKSVTWVVSINTHALEFWIRFCWYTYCLAKWYLYCTLASCGAMYCNRSCLWVCCLCVCVCGSVTTITRNCVHRSSPNWVCR